jgi:hypothetical protein
MIDYNGSDGLLIEEDTSNWPHKPSQVGVPNVCTTSSRRVHAGGSASEPVQVSTVGYRPCQIQTVGGREHHGR